MPTAWRIQMEDALFRTDSAVFMPDGLAATSSTSSSDAPPSAEQNVVYGLDCLKAALEFQEENPQHRLLITGHADTVGPAAYNKDLSVQRARAVELMLSGGEANRRPWAAIAARKHHPKDIQHICAWGAGLGWDTEPGPIDGVHGAQTLRAVRALHRVAQTRASVNITFPGRVTAATWEVVYALYQRELQGRIFGGEARLRELRRGLRWLSERAHASGCGESFPVDRGAPPLSPVRDGYASQANRRVELLFFDTRTAVTAPPCDDVRDCSPVCTIYRPSLSVRDHLAVNTLPRCGCALGDEGDDLARRLASTIEQAIVTTDAAHHADLSGPTGLFAGNYDYHSCVHAHWALLSIYRTLRAPVGEAGILARITEARLQAEWAFLRQNPTFEVPYGRAWLALMLSELGRHPGRNTAALRALRREVEKNVLDWLNDNRADDMYLQDLAGKHDSWLFSFFLMTKASPLLDGGDARLDSLYQSTVEPRRAGWRTRAIEYNDFLHVPSIIDTVDILRGRAVTPLPLPASRIADSPPLLGHAVGEEMTRLWPVSLSARSNAARCTLLQARIREWRAHPEHWEYGSRSDADWGDRFDNNSHWSPQFLWMAMVLRCEARG